MEESLGGGKGERSSPGAPVVVNCMITLCAHASMDCRTVLSVGTGREDDRRENPGTDNQWESGKSNNEMQRKSTNPGDEFLLVYDDLNQSGNITSEKRSQSKSNHPEEVK